MPEITDAHNKTLITHIPSIEEVRKRTIFFIMDCMLEFLCPEFFKILKQCASETGNRFLIEHHTGFKIIKKVE